MKKLFFPAFSLKKAPLTSWLMFSLLVFTAIIYTHVFQNTFTNWDDDIYILENPFLKSLSFENLKNIFSSYYTGNYHPITLVSLAIDYKIGGMNPWPYQLTNLLLHLCNVFLVYIFIKSLLQKPSDAVANYSVIALIAAGLFGIHTLHVESVAWVSERKNVLYTFFFLLSLVAYIKYIYNKSNGLYLLSIALFILSLLSKGTAVTLAACIIAIDYFTGRNILSWRIVREKVPYIALSLLFGFIAINAQRSAEAIGVPNNLNLLDRIAVAGYGTIQYLLKLVFPHHLSAFYPYPVKTGAFLPYKFYASTALFILLLFVYRRFFRQNRLITFGVLFFIVNIGIVIQLIPVGSAIMADRYVYVPSIGVFLIAGYLAKIKLGKNAIFKNSIITILTLYVTILSIKTFQRIGTWKDSITLWNDSIDKYPENNTRGYLNRASALYYQNNYSLALQDYEKLLQTDPQNGGAYIGIGLIRQAMNDTAKAMENYNKALSFGQLYQGYFNRALLKTNLNNFQGALLDLDKALEINPSKAEVYINKGFNLFRIGNYMEALENYDLALQIDPGESKAYQGRGQVKQAINDPDGAMAEYTMAISLYQSYDYYLNRASLKYALDDYQGALNDLDNAIRLNSMGYEAIFDKGLVLLRAGNMHSAIKEFDKAIKINKDDFEVYLNRGIAKYKLNNYEDALADLNLSVRLNKTAKALYYRGISHIHLGQKTEGCRNLKESAMMGNTDAEQEAKRNCSDN